MVKHIRRIQPGSSSPNTNVAINYPSGVTIGIPLEVCPSVGFHVQNECISIFNLLKRRKL